MADDTKGPLLNLDTLAARPTIVIDGQSFEIREPDEMTILDRQRQGYRGRRMQALLSKDGELTPEEQAELGLVLDAACRTILIAPDEVHQKLKDGHRQAIVDHFLLLSLRRRLNRIPTDQKTDQNKDKDDGGETGEKSSQTLSDSTAATH